MNEVMVMKTLIEAADPRLVWKKQEVVGKHQGEFPLWK